MKEIYSDLFQLAKTGQFTHCCITTNGFVKSNGECVMGRGCAKTIADMHPNIPKILGASIKKRGNVPCILHTQDNVKFISFPVKHKWFENADIELIVKSALNVSKRVGLNAKVLLPRPGCGNGNLNWNVVKKHLEDILDERFFIVHHTEGEGEQHD